MWYLKSTKYTLKFPNTVGVLENQVDVMLHGVHEHKACTVLACHHLLVRFELKGEDKSP